MLRTSLSAEEHALLVEYRQEQRKMILATDTVDKEKVVKSVTNLYKVSGFSEPKCIMVFDSPAMCLLAHRILDLMSLMEPKRKKNGKSGNNKPYA